MKKEYDFSRANRARFEGLPPQTEQPRHTKVRITIMLDQDILAFFKSSAAKPGAEPYQTQINRALRAYVSRGTHPPEDRLLGDDRFVARLAERVAEYSTTRKRRRGSQQRRP